MRGPTIIAWLFFAGLCNLPIAAGVTISVAPSVVGTTPEIVGYNSGHFMPGGNVADMWRYSGVNGARVWPTPTVVEGADDGGGWGDGVNSESTFFGRRAILRNDPLNAAYINWPHFESRYQNNPTTDANIINLNHAFGSLKSMGIDPMVAINRTNSGYPWDPAGTAAGWADRWEHWQHYYTQAFYLSKNFDVHRFQMYNEPNLDDDLTTSEYLERLQFASDAVQAAVTDVNRIYGKSLDPQMQGPVTAGGTTLYPSWGAPVVQNLHNTLTPEFRLIDTYAYQQYGAQPDTMYNQLLGLKNSVNVDAPGSGLRFAVTEFNVHTAANFDAIPETLDTPSKSTRLGAQLAQLANAQVDELYVFKFSQGPGDGASGVKKNGTHYSDNDVAPYNVGGVTKGGEVVRLFAKSFAGAHELFSIPNAAGTGATDFRISASRDNEQQRYYLFSANESTSARALSLNLSEWDVELGSRIIVEEVSADRHGEVSHVLTVPANKIVTLPGTGQPAQSVMLFSIPQKKTAYEVTLAATDDATVKAGSNANNAFGDSPNLYAKNEPTNPAARNVSFIKFNTGNIGASTIDQAILQVYGENTGLSSQVLAHVYGLTNDAWNEATLNWNNAPNLADSTTISLDSISENFIESVGSSAFFVGHFTGTAAERNLAIDVTRFLRDHPDQEVTFLVAIEVRFNGENVDDDLASLRLASKERGTSFGPQLLLSLSAEALPGDYNRDGRVDASDYVTWSQSFGSASLTADGNNNGLIDAGDYLVWRKNFGAVLPGLVAGNGSHGTVPEPAGLALSTCVTLLSLAARRRR